MTSPQKRKGSSAELAVAKWLRTWGSGAWVAFATPMPRVSVDMAIASAVMRFNSLPSVCPIYNPHPRRGDAGDVPCARRGRRTIRFSA